MIEIRQDSPFFESLTDYATVPISFHGRSQMAALHKDDKWSLTEITAASFFKDYDLLEHPTAWASRFDVSNWTMFSALDDRDRVGGAIVAIRTPGVDMLEGRDDLAVLWGIRIVLNYRKKGIGSQLFIEAAEWSRSRGCRELKVETQQLNVSACRFYESMGCALRDVRENRYAGLPEELQLLWYLQL